MKPSLIILLTLIFASLLRAADAPSVANLGDGESLVVEYSSTGCFHQLTEIITITREEASIASVESQWSPEGHKRIEVGRKPLGTVQLSDEDAVKLDALFQFYADGPQGGCTTVDQIIVSRLKGDAVVETYEFIDGSCRLYRMESVLTFGALKSRLEMEH